MRRACLKGLLKTSVSVIFGFQICNFLEAVIFTFLSDVNDILRSYGIYVIFSSCEYIVKKLWSSKTCAIFMGYPIHYFTICMCQQALAFTL